MHGPLEIALRQAPGRSGSQRQRRDRAGGWLGRPTGPAEARACNRHRRRGPAGGVRRSVTPFPSSMLSATHSTTSSGSGARLGLEQELQRQAVHGSGQLLAQAASSEPHSGRSSADQQRHGSRAGVAGPGAASAGRGREQRRGQCHACQRRTGSMAGHAVPQKAGSQRYRIAGGASGAGGRHGGSRGAGWASRMPGGGFAGAVVGHQQTSALAEVVAAATWECRARARPGDGSRQASGRLCDAARASASARA